jgi:hypothetical protein
MAFDRPQELLAELRLALDEASSQPAVDGRPTAGARE